MKRKPSLGALKYIYKAP